MPVFNLFQSINPLLVLKLVITTKQWTTIERNFDDILRLEFN